MLPQIGPDRNYVSAIFTPDAGRAVAAVGAPAGIYNVCDDNPVTFAECLRILAASVHAPRPLPLPGAWGMDLR